jgi:hypothetical protein
LPCSIASPSCATEWLRYGTSNMRNRKVAD